MKITRQWAMPNSKTFSIKPIKNLIEKYVSDDIYIASIHSLTLVEWLK